MKTWFLYLFWALLAHPLWAAEAVRLADQNPMPLGRHVSWIEVRPDDPAFRETRPGPWMDRFEPKTRSWDVLNFSFTRNRFWFALKLENTGDAPRSMVIETATAWLDHVELFTGEGFQDSKLSGDLLPHRDWAEPYRYPAFTVTIPPHSVQSFWLLVHTQDNMVIPLQIWDAAHYASWDRQRNLFFGLFHGLLLTIVILNSAMFIFSRRESFLIYSLYISSYTIVQFALDGFLAETIGFLPPWFLNRLYGAFTYTTIGFAGLFAVNFLETRKYSPRLGLFVDLSCKGFVGIGLLSFCLPYPGLIMRTALVALFCYSPIVLICAVKAVRNRLRSATFFAWAWAPLIFSTILLAITAFDFLPSSVYSRSFLYFGIAGEFIILSIGLGDQLARAIRHHAVVVSNLEAAEAVQKALIPAMPSIAGFAIHSWYQAAEYTGGDWFDVIEDKRHQRLYCFIGDVTGHGISSTLVTSAVSGTVHSFLEEKFLSEADLETTLNDLVVAVNRTVHRTGVSAGRLLTMNLIGIDLTDLSGVFLNAGHCHPLLFREGRAQPLMSQGSMLGLTDDLRIVKKTFQLVAGDLLFLYSDGLIHKHSEPDVELKLHRVIRLGSDVRHAEDLVQRVRAKYLETYGSHQLEDDCSLLALEVLARPVEHQSAS